MLLKNQNPSWKSKDECSEHFMCPKKATSREKFLPEAMVLCDPAPPTGNLISSINLLEVGYLIFN